MNLDLSRFRGKPKRGGLSAMKGQDSEGEILEEGKG
jgi:hypothetical protein